MIKGKLTPEELANYLRGCNEGEALMLICTILFDQHDAITDLQNQLGLNEKPVEEVQETKRKR